MLLAAPRERIRQLAAKAEAAAPVAASVTERMLRLAAGQPLMVVFGVSVLLLLAGGMWIFPRPDTVDPWIYLGYFLHPRHLLKAFPSAYYGSRLPVILPGHVCFSFFTPATAQVVLRLAMMLASAMAVFRSVQTLFGRQAALLAAVLYQTYWGTLSAIGLGHVDGFAIMYLLIGLSALTDAAVGERPRGRWVAAGVAGAMFVYTNVAYVALLPGVVLYYVWLDRNERRHGWRRSTPWLGAGFGGATVMLAVIHAMLCRRIVFFAPSASYAVSWFGKQSVCFDPSWTWVGHATWLVVPLLVLLAIGAVVRGGGLFGEPAGRRAGALFAGFGATFCIMGVLETCGLIHFLQFSFYASLLIPSMFLAIGGLAALAFERSEPVEREAAWLIPAVLGTVVFTPPIGALFEGAAWMMAAGLAAGAAVTGLWVCPGWLWRRRLCVSLAAGCVLNFVLAHEWERFMNACPLERSHVMGERIVGTWVDVPRRTARTDDAGFGIGQREVLDLGKGLPAVTAAKLAAGSETTQYPTRVEALEAVVRGVNIIREHDLHGDMRFWYDVAEPMGSVYSAVASTYLWDARLVSMHFPKRVDEWGRAANLEASSRVAILSADREGVEDEARRAVEEGGLQMRVVARETVREGVLPIRITVVEIRR
jgi:hypothetical protein